MSIKNLFNENTYDIYVDNLNSNTAQINNLSVDLINGLPPPSSSPISAPVNSILTVTSPGTATFSQNANINELNVLGNLQMNNNSGSTNQFLKKTSATTQDWVNLTPSEIFQPVTPLTALVSNSSGNLSFNKVDPPVISPGPNNSLLTSVSGTPTWSYLSPSNFASVTPLSALVSDGSGNLSFDKVDPEIITPGINNYMLMTLAGQPIWNLITPSNIAPNVPNVALVTNPLGIPVFDKINTQLINNGSSNQVLVTNNSGSLSIWSSTLGINSILFTGNISNFQSSLDRYYTSNIQLPLYAISQGGSPNIYQSIDVEAYVSIIGKRVQLTIFPFVLSSLMNGAVPDVYMGFRILQNYMKPANLLGFGNEGERQASCECSISQGVTTQINPAYANVYNNYYGSNFSYIEIVKSNVGNFVANDYHGQLFSSSPPDFFELKCPFTISYIAE